MTVTEMKCDCCGCEIDDSNDMGVVIDGESQDVCEECYYENTNECIICGERVNDCDTGEYIVVKSELGETCDRPPGIYRILCKPFLSIPLVGSGSMSSYSVMFIDKLPKLDREYEISGHICRGCAQPFADKCNEVYGPGPHESFDESRWSRELQHTRATILSNQEMLRDLECDSVSCDSDGRHLDYADASHWSRLKKLYDLPDLPTFHHWLFVEHRGVRVYRTSLHEGFYGSYVGWLSLSPEPRFRSGAGRLFPQTFSATGLPTHVPYDSTEQAYHEHRNAMSAVIAAIEQGFLRQDGGYDAEWKPCIYS